MQDKLYSRKRIRIPKLKKINGFKLFIMIILFIVVGSIFSFIYSAYPIFKASCETAASSTAIKIVNDEVVNVMKGYTYHELMTIGKDENGNIKYLEANIVSINELVSKITTNIQKRLDNTPRTTVFINMGSISGITAFKNVGPQFDIELETAGRLKTNIQTEFESVGINQTLHKIYLDLETRVGILTPLSTFGTTIASKVLLTEAIIVGEVPNSYYNFDGMTDKGDALEVIE